VVNLGISCIILSGGQAKRMDGIDKGLARLDDKPLIGHVIDRIAPQVDELMINANRELAQYQTFNLPILKDENNHFIGPLAGFSLGLAHAKYDYVLIVPCDSPKLPLKLASQLQQALTQNNADIAVASSGGHAHPVICLMRKSVSQSLARFIALGERKVSQWQKSLNYIEVAFSNDNEFVNVNTLVALTALKSKP
jgi:molybdenum cofactor guanylyltransferase